MNFFSIEITWVDFALVVLLLLGATRGRKRGMSQEVLDLMKWVLIVVVGGHMYQPVGQILSHLTGLSALTCYGMVYALIVALIFGIFSAIRRVVGDKLVKSDAFGGGEYDVGMVAGAVRYFCVIIVCLAFLGARHYTAEEIKAEDAFQESNFGSIRLPTLSGLQRTVFEKSLSGSLARKYMDTYLIEPSRVDSKPPAADNLVHARENSK